MVSPFVAIVIINKNNKLAILIRHIQFKLSSTLTQRLFGEGTGRRVQYTMFGVITVYMFDVGTLYLFGVGKVNLFGVGTI